MNTFDITAEIAAEIARRARCCEALSDPDNLHSLTGTLDTIAASTGKIRALKMVGRFPASDRRAGAIRVLCEMSQKTPPVGNETLAFAAERDMYAVLIERNLV